MSYGDTWDPDPPILVAPADGHATSEGFVPFTVRAENIVKAEVYRAEITVYDATGQAVNFGNTAWGMEGQAVTGTTTLPLRAGVYTWSAAVVNFEFGVDSAEATPRRTLVVAANRPPTASLVSPTAGHTFAAGASPTFTMAATDPEGQQWVGRIEVRNAAGTLVSTFATAPTASGQSASARPPLPFTEGSYEWRATATDTEGATSTPTGWRGFTVAGQAGNNAPGAPVLVAPTGGAYPFGEPATFTVRADDPDLDPYRARITVRHSDGTEYDIDTLYAASGTEASGSPSTILPAGTYTWWAYAEDLRGATGPQSEVGSFSVSTGRVLVLMPPPSWRW